MTQSRTIEIECPVCNLLQYQVISITSSIYKLKDFSDAIMNHEPTTFYEMSQDPRVRMLKELLGSDSHSFALRCVKCDFVFFPIEFKISNELKSKVLSREFFEEFTLRGLDTVENWEILAKILIFENYPSALIAKAYILTLKYCEYDLSLKETIIEKLEYYLLELMAEKEKFLDIDKNISFALLGEWYRRIANFDKSIEYFSYIEPEFKGFELATKLSQLSEQHDSSIKYKIHPLDK